MILPRQPQNDPSSSPLPTTLDPSEPPNPTLIPAPSSPPRMALQLWQIVVIVIGVLALLGALGTLFICIRTRLTLRRGASTTRFGSIRETNAAEFAIENNSPDTRRGSNARDMNGSGVNRERRDSVIDDAKVQIRRLMKKSRPPARSASYPSSPTYKGKGGVDFGLSALRFNGGGEKVSNGNGGNSKGKKGRRKSQNGIDVRIRSADDHADDEYAQGGNKEGGLGPFMRNDNAAGSGSGSGFAVGSAGSGARLIGGGGAALTTPRREDDAFLASARPCARERASEDWGYGDHSIAHTVRGSFEDAEEEERQRAIAQQHQQLGAAVERLAAESNSRPAHDRERLR